MLNNNKISLVILKYLNSTKMLHNVNDVLSSFSNEMDNEIIEKSIQALIDEKYVYEAKNVQNAILISFKGYLAIKNNEVKHDSIEEGSSSQPEDMTSISFGDTENIKEYNEDTFNDELFEDFDEDKYNEYMDTYEDQYEEEPSNRVSKLSIRKLLQLFVQYRAIIEKKAEHMILSSSTLREINSTKPTNLDELAVISGIGDHKLEEYGKEILQIVNGKDTFDLEEKYKSTINATDFEQELYENDRITVSRIASMIKNKYNIKITGAQLNKILEDEGYLKTIEHNGSTSKVATDKGENIGIKTITETKGNKTYNINIYSKNSIEIIKMLLEL